MKTGIEPFIYTFQSGNHCLPPDMRWHSIFALRMKSIYTPLEYENGRIGEALRQQVDFLNALYRPSPPTMFELRYISTPHPRYPSAGNVTVGMLVKVSGRDKEEAEKEARNFYPQFIDILVGMLKDYEWELVRDEEGFKSLWQPFEFRYLAEIRRRESIISLERLGRRPGLVDSDEGSHERESMIYFVHPFVPTSNTLTRLLKVLLLGSSPCLYSVSLMPVVLERGEKVAMEEELAKAENFLKNRALSSTSFTHRAEMLCQGLLELIYKLEDAPFQLKIQVASDSPLDRVLLEAIGTEITAPISWESSLLELQRGGYDVVFPSDEEVDTARHNLRFMDYKPWGEYKAPSGLTRLRYLVDAREANSAFRFPIPSGDEPIGIEVRFSRSSPLPPVMTRLGLAGTNHLPVGKNIYLGVEQPVFLSKKDRAHHFYCVGQTGTGKTTLLKRMILNDMQAGEGVIVIDPHGDLFKELLGLVPEDRVEDVVVFDPTDSDYPVGINFLEWKSPEERDFIAREMKGIMERLLFDQYGRFAGEMTGPIFYQHLQNTLLLAMSNSKSYSTLVEVYEIFRNIDVAMKLCKEKNVEDSRIDAWCDLLKEDPELYTSRARGDITLGEWVSSKLEDFAFDWRLRLIFGQKRSTIDFEEILNEGKIMLVNLAKGELTEANSRFLGMILMAKILSCGMRRVQLKPEERRICYLYVDEFQSIATESFVLMLSEARKFGLRLILANQFISQIKDQRIVESIFGNVGTLVSFRVGREDARILAPQFAPTFNEQDLSNLPNWQACMRTTVDGQVVAPFTLQTILPDEKPDQKVAETVRAKSRRKYARPRKQVEREIEEFMESIKNTDREDEDDDVDW